MPSTSATEDPSNSVATYAKALRGHDELFGENGQVLPHWMPFVNGFRGFSVADLEEVRSEIRGQLRENGVSVHVHGDPAGTQRTWELDPVPLLVDAEDWADVESGLRQRAILLNAILEDLYDKQSLIEDGSLPMELVYRHPGFLRPCDGIRLPGEHQLLLYAADLARGPDDRMWVVNDRTQAPSGSGYALENRSAMTRALPQLFQQCDTRRLAGFFRTLRSMLSGFGGADPRIVVMTPGPLNETYFEHAYLAAYLGYTLVQGDDLTVRDSQVWLKSLGGLERVDVILRRVDEGFCDPLELRGDSMLGVPGLLEAVRCGNVVVANPLGTGVLENTGLMAFLPSLCRRLLGEELKMPSAATWWCGQEKAKRYVLEHLDRLVIKRIYRGRDLGTVFGAAASKSTLEALRQRIIKDPALYVGQEQVSFSTMPCLVGNRLEPRRGVLRAFLSEMSLQEAMPSCRVGSLEAHLTRIRLSSPALSVDRPKIPGSLVMMMRPLSVFGLLRCKQSTCQPSGISLAVRARTSSGQVGTRNVLRARRVGYAPFLKLDSSTWRIATEHSDNT